MRRIAKEVVQEDDSSMTSQDTKQLSDQQSSSGNAKADKSRPAKLTKEPPRTLTPASDLSNTATEIIPAPPEQDVRPETPKDQLPLVPSLISEPTAQFRHLLALEKTRSSSPLHLPLSRLRSRRATPDADVKTHNRKFSLGWNLRLHKSRAPRSTSMTPFEDQPSTDDNLTPISGLSKAPSIEFEAPTPTNVDGASLDLPTATAESEQSVGDSEVATAVQTSAESTVQGDAEEAPAEVDEEPAWDDSDSSSRVDAPYWKEFDRLQERAFWERAPAIPQAAPEPALEPPQLEHAPAEAAEGAQEADDQGRGWFSAVRLSVSRRRWSMTGA
jgi:hypothetical protein